MSPDDLRPIPGVFIPKVGELAEALAPADLPDAGGRGRALILRVLRVKLGAAGGAQETADDTGILPRLVALVNGDDLVAQVEENIVLVRIGVLQLIERLCRARHGQSRNHGESAQQAGKRSLHPFSPIRRFSLCTQYARAGCFLSLPADSLRRCGTPSGNGSASRSRSAPWR